MPEHVVTSDVGRWGMVPEWLLDTGVSGQAIRLFAILGSKYADRDTASAHPSRARLADDMRTSPDTVDRALRELVEVGAVAVTKRRTIEHGNESNVYHLRYARPATRTDAASANRDDAAYPSLTDAARSISDPDPESEDPSTTTSEPAPALLRPRFTNPPLPPVTVRLEAVHAQLTGRTSPGVRDEGQIDAWVGQGCTLDHIAAALASIEGWAPDHPWGAFGSALGRAIQGRSVDGSTRSGGRGVIAGSGTHPGAVRRGRLAARHTGDGGAADAPPAASVVGSAEWRARYPDEAARFDARRGTA